MKIIKLGMLLLIVSSILVACGGGGSAASSKEYILTTSIEDGIPVFLGVGDEINGISNPELHAEPGQTITVTLINGGEGRHQIVFSGVAAQTEFVNRKGDQTSVTLTVPNNPVTLTYQDGDEAYASIGMKGALIVGGEVAEQSAPGQPVADHPMNSDLALQAIQKGGCSACHAIPGIQGAVSTIGPDLNGIAQAARERIEKGEYNGPATTAEEYIAESIQAPDAFIAPKCPSGPCQQSLMPASFAQTLSADEINAIVGYLSSQAGAPTAQTSTPDMSGMPSVAPADGQAVDITRDPAEIPAPIGDRGPGNVRVDLETIEVSGVLADGSTYSYWTFGGRLPGPFIRVRVGDTVEVHLKNAMNSTMTHSVDFHAVTGPGGGAVATQTKPGEETMFTFKAINAGLYVYHCATPMVAQHISNGMYGLILVEPAGGLSKVDREFYVMQGEIYTTQPFGTAGALTGDTAKLLDERPEYFVFNGAALALAGDAHALHARVGETVRIFFGVGGPNFTSSFHVIGEIFDRVFDQASLTSNPLTDVQTTLVPPGGATMVEFMLEVPGRYILVDHALSRLQRGLAGYLMVDGDPNLDVFNGVAVPGSGH